MAKISISGSGDYAFKHHSSGGDVYVCGQATAGQGGDDTVVAKFDGSLEIFMAAWFKTRILKWKMGY